MAESLHADLEALLSRSGWVRSLASGLLGDDHLADDALQESWRVALEKAPRDGRPLVRWFTAVVRNFARQEHRLRFRRLARERAVARPEAVEENDAALERLELQRRLVDAVEALPESFRTVICLRYFDGLSPREIAERTDTPLRTVHTRLSRALKALRRDLERSSGGPRALWSVLLAPMSTKETGWIETAMGVLVMDAKLKWTLSIAALVLVGVPLYLWSDESPSALRASSTTLADDLSLDVPDAAIERAGEIAAPEPEVRVELEPRAEKAPAAAVEQVHFIPCRVLDDEGRPVPGVHLRLEDERESAVAHVRDATDARGYVQFPDPGRSGALEIVEDRFVSVLSPDIYQAHEPRVVVVAERMRFAGIVVDREHRPLAGATVQVRLPGGFRSRFEHVLDQITLATFTAKTCSDGRFDLGDAPGVSSATLAVDQVGFELYSEPLPLQSNDRMEIVLTPLAPEQVLRGTVVDASGVPTANVYVSTSHDTTKSDADGRFTLTLSPDADISQVEAVKRGHLPGRIQPAMHGDPARPVWPDPLVLQLGAAPLSIHGRVVLADGTPAHGVLVWTDDERHFGPVEMEGFEMRLSLPRNIESLLRDGMHEDRVRTNDDGSFELSGLLPTRYRLTVFDERSLVFLTTAPIEPGDRDVEIVLPREPVHSRIAGRALSRAGVPVPGVDVVLSRDVIRTNSEDLVGISGAPDETDEEGRFEFTNVARGVSALDVLASQKNTDVHFEILAGADLESLELEIPLRCHFKVDLDQWQGEADSFEVLDASETVISVTMFHGNIAWGEDRVAFVERRSEVGSTTEDAQTIVLYANDVEVGRVVVKLVPGELNTIRP